MATLFAKPRNIGTLMATCFGNKTTGLGGVFEPNLKVIQ